MILRSLLLLLFLIPIKVRSEVIVATGFSSVTEGRSVPMLNIGIDNPTSAFLFGSVGVKTDVYYHNAYMLSAYRQVDLEDFWWGKVRAGLGGGIFYSKRGYKDRGPEETGDDFGIGPSVRATWEIFHYGFVGIESYFGIGDLKVFVLSTQQVSHLVFGVRF